LKREHVGRAVDLPTPFHSRHDAYTTYVNRRIDKLIKDSPDFSLQDIKSLQDELVSKINDAYKHFETTGESLNTFFKKGLHQ
jgi:hypothetical protein